RKDLPAAPQRGQPARRIRAVRGRLQAALLGAEIAAGLVGGAVLAILAGLEPVGCAVSGVGFLLVWRTLGAASGICADDDLRPWTSTLRKSKTTAVMALAISWVAYGALSLDGANDPAAAALTAAGAAAVISIVLRGTANTLVYRSSEFAQRTVIVGSGMVARQVYDRLQ